MNNKIKSGTKDSWTTRENIRDSNLAVDHKINTKNVAYAHTSNIKETIGISIIAIIVVFSITLTIIGLHSYFNKAAAYDASVINENIAHAKMDKIMIDYPAGVLNVPTILRLDDTHYVGRVQFGPVVKVCDFNLLANSMTCRGGIPTVTVQG